MAGGFMDFTPDSAEFRTGRQPHREDSDMSIRRAALQNGMAIGLTLAVAVGAWAQQIPYPALAKRIVTALAVHKSERGLLGYDAKTLGPLLPEVTRQLEAAGANGASLAYGPAPDLAERLA